MNMKVENEMALPITKSVTVMLLEPYAGKLARTVLRGESSRKGADLLDHFFRYNIKKQSGTDIIHMPDCFYTISFLLISKNWNLDIERAPILFHIQWSNGTS